MTAPIIPFETTEQDPRYARGWMHFRVGTCGGLWRCSITGHAYEILTVVNKQKGNGHFKQAMLWFEQSCRRDGKDLIVRECWNPRLMLMLRRHGFEWRPLFDWVKSFV